MAKSVAGEPADGFDNGENVEIQPWHVRARDAIRDFTWNHHMGIAIAQSTITGVTLILLSLASIKYLLS